MLGYLEVADMLKLCPHLRSRVVYSAQPQKSLATPANSKGLVGLQSVPATLISTRILGMFISKSVRATAKHYSHNSGVAKFSDLESRPGDFEHLLRRALGLVVMSKDIGFLHSSA